MYTYTQAHFPNNVSWYREVVRLDDKVVGEILESCESTFSNKVYRVIVYRPLTLSDGDVIEAPYDVTTFSTISDCKDFINNGGLN